jgi:CDP-4-dehydro-6-deoxyglucose reductase
MFLVTLINGKSFQAKTDQSLLEAALFAGISLPYSCKTGRCNTCQCPLVKGETVQLRPELGLSATDINTGLILTCARAAASDLVLDAQELAALPPARTIVCKINSLEKVAPDVLVVGLRLPPAENFTFLPGQYIEVIGPQGIRRSYSLANSNQSSKLLELHIRAVPGGALSSYWFEQAKINDLLRLNGPLGTFFLRNTANLELILLATGTGIAPVKAILEALPTLPPEEQPRSVSIFWGARTQSDFYIDMKQIAATHTFTPVLSRPDRTWTGVRGHVQDALLKHSRNLTNSLVYACGSESMIHSAKEALDHAGLPVGRFLSDAFVCSAAN